MGDDDFFALRRKAHGVAAVCGLHGHLLAHRRGVAGGLSQQTSGVESAALPLLLSLLGRPHGLER